jgi:hypothetical protein
MSLLQRLPDSAREPPGLEWIILRKVPIALVVPLLLVWFGSWMPPVGSADLVEKHQTSQWIFAVSLWLTAWTAIFTVSIACVIVWIMKGPAYVADRYDLIDAEAPAVGRTVDAQPGDVE